ncbi:MAG: phosphoglycerate kinase [Parcubacteria bacterium C7867-006]|nr:MAG: phosphoglycerate kinase [Parcubacteria bacterium C7867-006]
MKYIDELKGDDLKGKYVLLRLDLNVPVSNGQVVNAYRIDRAIPTIDYLREHGAKVIIIAHTESDANMTLVPVAQYLSGFFKIDFCQTYFNPIAIDKISKLEDRGVLLFENLRINPEEKENNIEFAKKLAQMADIYVDDAFGAMHRKHASIIGVPEFLPHYGGLLLKQEIENLSKVFSPKKPFLFIVGGVKFSTKLPLIKKYLDKADYVFIVGALANGIFKEKGFTLGTSLSIDGDFGIKELMNKDNFLYPIDVTVQKSDGSFEFRNPDEIGNDEYIGDLGPKTMEKLKELIGISKTVVWNGPLGDFEKGFKDKTEQLAEVIMKATEEGKIESIVGGGDTLASININEFEHGFTFVSTGGGAMLDYLVNETLPGIEALNK